MQLAAAIAAERCPLCGADPGADCATDCGTELAMLRSAVRRARPSNLFFIVRA